MNRLIWIFLFLGLAACKKGPHLDIPSPKHDFGKLIVGDKAEHLYAFSNTGDEELIIRSIQSSCGCTVADVFVDGKDGIRRVGNPDIFGDVLRVKPGEIGAVHAYLDTQRLSGSEIQKTGMITLTTNEAGTGYNTFQFSVNISKPYKLEKEHFDFGTKGRKEIKQAVIRLFFTGTETFEVKKIRSSLSGIKLTVSPLEDGVRTVLILDFEAGTDVPLGSVSGTVDLETTMPSGHHIQIPVYGIVNPDVLVKPNLFQFPMIQKGEEARCKVKLECTDPGVAFQIKRAWIEGSEAENLTATVLPVTEGKIYEVELLASSKVQSAAFRGNVKIETNVPDQPTVEIPYRGFLK